MTERRQARGGTLIIGGGFAGAYVARLLGRSGATILSPDNFMLYTPLLPEAASGTLEPRHVVVPLRRMCPHSELLLGTATALDDARRAVTAETLGGTFEISYERLVVAVGAVTRVLPVPGLAEHGLGFKDVADAIALRNRVLRQLESAAARVNEEERRRDLGFVFVGAGYAGVEALAELNDLAHGRGAPDPRARSASGSAGCSSTRRRRSCRRSPRGSGGTRTSSSSGVASRYTSARRSSRSPGAEAVLSNGIRVPARTLVWAAGVRPNPVVEQLGLPVDGRGRVVVDSTLAV